MEDELGELLHVPRFAVPSPRNGSVRVTTQVFSAQGLPNTLKTVSSVKTKMLQADAQRFHSELYQSQPQRPA